MGKVIIPRIRMRTLIGTAGLLAFGLSLFGMRLHAVTIVMPTLMSAIPAAVVGILLLTEVDATRAP